MSARARAYIDINALHHNLSVIKKIAPHSRVLAMVKANAYGHGMVAVGKVLTEADGFGVACLDEAIALRHGGVCQSILIMSGVYTKEDLMQVQQFNLHIVIHDWFQIKLLDTMPIKQPIGVWLKLDTGMHRLGFSPQEFEKAHEYLINSDKIAKPLVIMTHLADADNINKETTTRQINCFRQYASFPSALKSVANSAGILAWPEAIADWNRPGIMMYGISPLIGKKGCDHGLLPVMTLTSKIAAIHDLKQGDAVGYGGTWICPHEMRIGVVAIGYGDGYPRHATNGTPILVGGNICPLVGRVSMDLITVDLSNSLDVQIGDDVILWGNGLPAESVAQYANTIAYELTCNVSQRVDFTYRG